MFAYSCRRSKGFIREVLPNALVFVGLVRPLIRSALSLPKNCSSKVKPAPGTCSRASFSFGSLVMRLQGFECGALLVRNDVGHILVEPLPESPACGFQFTRPLNVFGYLLLCVLFLRIVLLLRNRPGGGRQKKQRSKRNVDPSSAHKTPRGWTDRLRNY